jgi:hypothetical protein
MIADSFEIKKCCGVGLMVNEKDVEESVEGSESCVAFLMKFMTSKANGWSMRY